MKRKNYIQTALLCLALWLGVGSAVAQQTAIPSFPFNDEVNNTYNSYLFSVSTPVVLTVSQTGSDDVYASVYRDDQNGNSISCDGGYIGNSSLKTVLPPGDYRLQIQKYSSGVMNLTVDATPITATPYSMGNTEPVSLSAGELKLWTFTLAENALVRGSISSMFNVQLLNTEGIQQSNVFYGNEAPLQAGVYYVIAGAEEEVSGSYFSLEEITAAPITLNHAADYPLAGYESKWLKFTLNEFATVELGQTGVSYLTATMTGGNFYSNSFFIDNGQTVSTLLFPGEYYLRIQNDEYDSRTVSLTVNKTAVADISVPCNNNYTMYGNEQKVLKFTLPGEMYLTGTYSDAANISGARLYNADASRNYYLPTNYSNSFTLPAGTYYVMLEMGWLEPGTISTVNLKLDAIDLAAVPLYSTADFSAALPKESIVSGTLTQPADLYKSVIPDAGGKSETNLALMKAFTLSVTAGKQYRFTLSEDITVGLLKSGALTGNPQEDIKAYVGEGMNVFYADATEDIRVLVVCDGGINDETAYVVKVAESNSPLLTPIETLFAGAELLDYSALPVSRTVAFTPSTPNVKVIVDWEDEDELPLTWVTPALAYKVNIPAVNTGLTAFTTSDMTGALVYQKKGNTYELLLDDDDLGDFFSTQMEAGEYYILVGNYGTASVGSFDVKIAKETAAPAGITLKQLLDGITDATTLAHSSAGNTASGTFVTDLETSYSYDSPSKVVAWKVTLTETSDLIVHSNQLSLYLFARDGYGNYYAVTNGWNGNISMESLSAGNYYIVGAIDYSYYTDGNYDIQIATSMADVQLPRAVSFATSVSSIGVNPNAGDAEVRAMLGLLPLYLVFDDGQKEELYNAPSYWIINGTTATFDFMAYAMDNIDWLMQYDFTYFDEENELTLTVNYTGNELPNSVNTASKNSFKVYTEGNTVYASGVEAGLPYALYGISGSIVAQGTAASDVLSINVPQKGVYILRIGTQVQKVLVR